MAITECVKFAADAFPELTRLAPLHMCGKSVTVEEAEFGFQADPLAFADVLEEGKCFSFFGERCFDRWAKCCISSHLGA